MIKAKITVFDDETGREILTDRVIQPKSVEVSPVFAFSKTYIFEFGFSKFDQKAYYKSWEDKQ